MPRFENVVSEKLVTVTPEQATCGLRNAAEYCIQTLGIYRECNVCDGTDPANSHPPKYLTDTQNNTYWQSVTMQEGVHMTGVNLTVNLGRSIWVHMNEVAVNERKKIIISRQDRQNVYIGPYKLSSNCR